MELADFGLRLPDTHEVADIPRNHPPDWEKITHNGKIIYGSDRPIQLKHVKELLEKIAREGNSRETLVLSGSHGNKYGKNWCKRSLMGLSLGSSQKCRIKKKI